MVQGELTQKKHHWIIDTDSCNDLPQLLLSYGILSHAASRGREGDYQGGGGWLVVKNETVKPNGQLRASAPSSALQRPLPPSSALQWIPANLPPQGQMDPRDSDYDAPLPGPRQKPRVRVSEDEKLNRAEEKAAEVLLAKESMDSYLSRQGAARKKEKGGPRKKRRTETGPDSAIYGRCTSLS